MATSFLHSARGKRNGALGNIEESIEEQIESLRDEIAALAKLLGKSGTRHGARIRDKAEAGYEDLLERSEDLVREIQDGYLRGASEVRATVRRHPVATIGAAAAVGIVLALLARR